MASHEPRDEPECPSGPDLHAPIRQPGLAKAKALDGHAEKAFDSGETAGERSDDYIRTTVFLASVLFLVGISTGFPLRGARYALVGLGAVMLVISVVLLTQLPGPPT